MPYVPSRLDEGHGLSLAAVDAAVDERRRADRDGRLRHDQRRRDRRRRRRAGSTSSSPTTTASRPILPAALAIVNPHRPDATYPDRRLAGSGVAFKVAQLLLADEPGGPAAALDLADLATIGTVADVAPIVGENRAIARLGLERLRRRPGRGSPPCSSAPGSRPPPSTSRPSRSPSPRGSTRPAGWGRPSRRPSAAGRRPGEAATHADALEAANLTRRDLMKVAVAEARAAVADGGGDAGDGRARPVERRDRRPRGGSPGRGRGRPAVVGADLGDVVRASCRSDGSLDLGAALERCGDLFIRYGGHAGAAGFELPTERWDAFRERFLAVWPPRRRRPIRASRSRSTWRCRRSDVDYGLYRELARPRAVRPGQPRPARGGPRPDRHARPRRDRRPQPADPAPRARRARRHRLRPAGHRRGRPRGRPARRRRAAGQPAVRRLRVAPARDPRRRDLGQPARDPRRSSAPRASAPSLAGNVS